MNKKMKSKKRDVFDDNSIKVPFVVPNIELSDKRAIERALKSNLLTDGPILRKFEKAFSKFTGSKYEIGVSCPNCFNKRSKDQKYKSRERQKQIELFKEKGHSYAYDILNTNEYKNIK